MDETLGFAIFGVLLVCSGCIVLFAVGAHRWKKSEQRAAQEYLQFRRYLLDLDIEIEATKEVISQIKSADELYSINRRIATCLKKYESQQHQQ